MELYCCGCEKKVEPRLTSGEETYPHRHDLAPLPFWICDECRNFVGCHHKTDNPTRALGCIATQEIKNARKHIHALLDPIWKSGKMTRKEIYSKLSEATGRKYHTGNIRSIEEARIIYREASSLNKENNNERD